MEDDQSHAASSVLQDLVGTSCWPSILLKANMPLGNRAGEKHEQHEKRSKTSKLQPFWHRHHQTWLVLDEFNHFQSFLDIFLDCVRMMFGCFHCVSAMKWDYFWCTTFSDIFKPSFWFDNIWHLIIFPSFRMDPLWIRTFWRVASDSWIVAPASPNLQ